MNYESPAKTPMNCFRYTAALMLFFVAARPATAQILPPGATPTKLTPTSVGGFSLRFTEGPLYDRAGGVYFTDLGSANEPADNPSRIFRYDIASGVTSLVDGASGGANGLFLDGNGQIIAAERGRRQVARRSATDVTAVETVLANNYLGEQFNGPNDLVLDASGGIYFTDPNYDNRNKPEALYYVDSAGTVSQLLTFSTSVSNTRPVNKRPNGVALSHDGSTLYLAVELNNRIMAYDVGPGGAISNARQFARTDVNAAGTVIPGINNGPDGITLDAAGNVYSAVKNAVFVWSPTGERLADIAVPLDPTNVDFGDADGRTLFITAGNALYGIVLNVPSPALGDFDGDGNVTAADYTVWRDTLGATENLSADGDGSKVIDAGDYDAWKSHFGNALGSGAAATSHAVPEPDGWALLVGWLISVVRSRRRS